MKVLADGPESRAERPASMLLHDEPNARVVAFRLLPGQIVPPHSSTSTVIVQVTAGSGIFRGATAADEATLRVGESAVYAPDEMHAIEATTEELQFLAIITPRPG